MSQWLNHLNPEQKAAATHTKGPLLILAGAGSGKTTVLVSRTGQLISSGTARPQEILVLTFTNKAARELKHRVVHKLGERADGIWAGTFHSFGLQMLKVHHKEAGLPKGFGILDASDTRQVLKDLLKGIRVTVKEGFDIDTLMGFINQLRSGESIAPDAEEVYVDLARVVKPKFEKRISHLGAVDFESLLLKPIELLENYPEILQKYQERYQQVMVDEFQDTNRLQMRLIDLLVKNHRNITVVGDDDQSIYGWRGAEVKNILDFPKRYRPCEVVKLERNYRSSAKILSVANEVIKKNQARHDKVLKAEAKVLREQKPEVFVYESDDKEVDEVVEQIRHFQRAGYKNRDIAILFRSNAQGGLLEGALRRAQLPYALTGGTQLIERTEVKDVLAYLRCSLYPHEIAIRRVINVPSRGIGETTIEALEAYARQKGVNFTQAVRAWREAGVPARAGEGIESFIGSAKKLIETLLNPADSRPIADRLTQVMMEAGYRDHVMSQYKDPQVGQAKWQLVEILGRILEGFFKKGGASKQTLRDFLEALELRDAEEDKPEDALQLLTLHASKGLEFPVVILMGIEEDLLPHRTLGSDISEERRLFYVGVTRAKERLVLTRARSRKRFGKIVPVAPSRFLEELPKELFDIYESGFRPVTEGERKSLLQDFLKKAEKEADRQKLTK